MKNCLYLHQYLQLKDIFRLTYSLTGISSWGDNALMDFPCRNICWGFQNIFLFLTP